MHKFFLEMNLYDYVFIVLIHHNSCINTIWYFTLWIKKIVIKSMQVFVD
jgi:hypothetical protein